MNDYSFSILFLFSLKTINPSYFMMNSHFVCQMYSKRTLYLYVSPRALKWDSDHLHFPWRFQIG